MLFNSISFAVFLPIVFFLYWFVVNKNLKWQNFLLLTASYYFYAKWDWRFMFLLMFSTFLDYYTGLKMQESKNNKARAFWLWLSIGINLGFLSASIISSLISSNLFHSLLINWRLAFIIGGVFGLISYFLHKNLIETISFSKYQKMLKKEIVPISLLFKNHANN